MRSIAIRLSSGLLLACLALLASGCGDSTACSSGAADCDGVCADLKSNVYHCGACGKACGPYESCTAGQCSSCPQGSLVCPGTGGALACTPVTEDAANCGGCGVVCRAPEGGGTVACKAGVCIPACPAPSQLCSANLAEGQLTLACVDTASSAQHCGACGNACGAHQLCAESACADCPVGQLRCKDAGGLEACTPVLYSAENCGACGRACPAGKSCQNGVCAGPGLSPCPAARPELPPVLVDLDNDPANCGACGNLCLSSEVCREAACRPCPVAACGNRCVDTGRDDLHCGGCNKACLSGLACVAGVCAEPVKITLLAPLDRGHAPTTAYSARVRVESALPIKRVVLESPLLPAPAEMALLALANVPPTEWAYSMPALDVPQVELTVRAFDILYVEGAADAEAHSATFTATLPTRTPPTTTPNLEAFGPEGALAALSWIATNAPPVRFEATNLGPTAARVTLVDEQSRAFASAPVEGGKAVFLVKPGDLPIRTDSTLVRACVWDDAGQSSSSACSSPALELRVGRVPTFAGAAPALTTAGPDGTGALHWFAGAPTPTGFEGRPESPILTVPAEAMLAALPTTSALPGRYLSDSLQRAEATGALLAIRGDATAVDRLECAPGAAGCAPTARAPYLSAGAHHVVRLQRVTATTVLAVASTGELLVAYPTAPGEPAATLAAPDAAPCFPDESVSTADATTLGGILFWCQDTPSPTPTTRHRLLFAAPKLGVVTLQPPFLGSARSVYAGLHGELLWSWTGEDGKLWASGTGFDGEAAIGAAAAPVEVGSAVAPVVQRRGTVLFYAHHAGTSLVSMFVLHVAPSARIAEPTPPSATVGALGGQVATRRGTPAIVAVSEDLLKVLYVTADPDGAKTLWLLDLDTATAQPLHRSRSLVGNTSWTAVLPHFVNSAAVLPSAGAPASEAPAAVPVVVFAETLQPGGPMPGAIGVRLFAARYDKTPSLPNVVQLDRPAFLPMSGAAAPITTTAAGSAVLFYEYRQGVAGDLYAFPLGGAAPSATARLVLENSAGYAVREDVGRLLVAHRSGLLLAGELRAGADPTLRPVLETTPRADFASAEGLPFGFTRDGGHAWSLLNARSAWTGTELLLGEVEAVDLVTGRRANFGTAAVADPAGSGSQASPCFLRAGSIAVGLSPLAPDLGRLQLFASAGTARAGFGLEMNLPPPLTCLVSADETEATLRHPVTGILLSVAAGATGVVGERLLSQAATLASQPWHRTPLAAPTAPEYEVTCGLRPAGLTGMIYKAWGGANGAAGASLPVTYAHCPQLMSLTRNETNRVLFGRLSDGNWDLPFVLPLGGHTPPEALLP